MRIGTVRGRVIVSDERGLFSIMWAEVKRCPMCEVFFVSMEDLPKWEMPENWLAWILNWLGKNKIEVSIYGSKCVGCQGDWVKIGKGEAKLGEVRVRNFGKVLGEFRKKAKKAKRRK